MAVSVGPPLDARHYLALPRDKVLVELQQAIQAMKDRAERLRRK